MVKLDSYKVRKLSIEVKYFSFLSLIIWGLSPLYYIFVGGYKYWVDFWLFATLVLLAVFSIYFEYNFSKKIRMEGDKKYFVDRDLKEGYIYTDSVIQFCFYWIWKIMSVFTILCGASVLARFILLLS